MMTDHRFHNPCPSRIPSTTFSSGSGDIALFYVQNAAASPSGVAITVSSASATYLQGVAAEYTNVASVGALDTTAVAKGVGTAVSAGPTGSVNPGELLFSAVMTGSSPNGATPLNGLTLENKTGSYSVDDADMTVITAGPQTAAWTLATSADSYEVAAVFHSAAGA